MHVDRLLYKVEMTCRMGETEPETCRPTDIPCRGLLGITLQGQVLNQLLLATRA